MGFEEIPHAADWALRVWSETLAGLLAEAARGMNALSGVALRDSPRVMRTYATEFRDGEDMLVRFLTELVYYAEQENLGFDQFDIEINSGRLKAGMEGAPLKSLGKSIKAVTWHNLEIEETARGLEVEIVFDV